MSLLSSFFFFLAYKVETQVLNGAFQWRSQINEWVCPQFFPAVLGNLN